MAQKKIFSFWNKKSLTFFHCCIQKTFSELYFFFVWNVKIFFFILYPKSKLLFCSFSHILWHANPLIYVKCYSISHINFMVISDYSWNLFWYFITSLRRIGIKPNKITKRRRTIFLFLFLKKKFHLFVLLMQHQNLTK